MGISRPTFHLRPSFLLVGLLVLVAACAGGQIILNLDIYSFIDDQDLSGSYQATLPATGTWIPLVGLVPPTEIQLIEGLGTASMLQEGVLQVEGEFDNELGTASARIDLFLGATAQDVGASLSPVMSINVDVADSTLTPFSSSVDLDQQTLDLFSNNSVWVRLDVWARVQGTPSLVDIKGVVTLTGLRARLLANEDLIRQ